MTSKMYAIQAPAFDAAVTYQPPTTNSTSDHPSIHTVNLEAACEAKKKIVHNLPTKCEHCDTPFNAPNCIVELVKTGDVMAYCRGQGGCGRSQVLFVGVKTSIPRYRKVCVFKHNISCYEPNEAIGLPSNIYALHGITPHETICDTCGQRYDTHPTGYDHNGWLEDGFDQLELPADWPMFRDGKFIL
ncbi:unnamed protein product [Adineta steineri]|uniref:Uncharacterized protein n=1 Tax=Adineta steineri TaxID=433720 RepID=A0A814LHN7_9BILA|nr:unnamed protein product [Adineta steineri]CAF1250571.1 unnamed protein product [Adineta steineri]